MSCEHCGDDDVVEEDRWGNALCLKCAGLEAESEWEDE